MAPCWVWTTDLPWQAVTIPKVKDSWECQCSTGSSGNPHCGKHWARRKDSCSSLKNGINVYIRKYGSKYKVRNRKRKMYLWISGSPYIGDPIQTNKSKCRCKEHPYTLPHPVKSTREKRKEVKKTLHKVIRPYVNPCMGASLQDMVTHYSMLLEMFNS